MSTFVLIHGACHGAWCWHKMIPLLVSRGHPRDSRPICQPTATTRGDRSTTLASTRTSTPSGEIVDAQPEPVVLVGHSMSGIVIGGVADRGPDNIRSLVYLSAVLPDMAGFLGVAEGFAETMAGHGRLLPRQALDLGQAGEGAGFLLRRLLGRGCAVRDRAARARGVGPLRREAPFGRELRARPALLHPVRERPVLAGPTSRQSSSTARPVRRVFSLPRATRRSSRRRRRSSRSWTSSRRTDSQVARIVLRAPCAGASSEAGGRPARRRPPRS